jgi:integrase
VRSAGKGMHAVGGGLYLHVVAGGARSWIFRYMLRGRAREMGLGPLHTVPLKEARERAAACRRQLLDGIDPIEARAAQRRQAALEAARNMTFRECAAAYIEAHKPSWKNAKHAAQWTATLESYVYPHFGHLAVQAVDTALVTKALTPIWSAKPETASRVRGRIETILDWATTSEYRTGENPARWRGHLENLLPKTAKVAARKRAATGRAEHHAAMPFDQVAAFMTALHGREAVSARALEFTILTAKRTEEVIGARRREIDAAERTWTIPAGRMKAEREHRVPLSDAAIAVLDAVGCFAAGADPAAYIFAGGKPGAPLTNMAMLRLLQVRLEHPDVTVHGFRSSFRDWVSERTNFPDAVAEMALAHVVDDKVEAAYRRGDLLDKRRQLMQAWATYCTTPAPAIGGQVVAMRSA